MWVYQRAIKLSHRASEIMYETMAVSLFTRNGALKTRYFAARKLTYRTRSLIYAKDCKDLFLSPTLIIVIAWVQTPPPPSQIPLPSDFCWGEGVCAQTTLLYVLSRSIKETRTKTLHYNNLKMCVKKKKDKNYLFEDSFFSFTGLLGAFFPVLWLLWKRVYSRWCSQISSTSCLFCSVYGYLSFQYHHCPQSVSMPRSQFSVY